MLAGKSKGGGKANQKGEIVYRKAQRNFRKVPIAYKARKVLSPRGQKWQEIKLARRAGAY